ncbi:hypothetical protein LTS07_003106 [Exophiala sideris]|uniref:Cytochrome P450 n=1 Tax=Exophiala sideris TaxID=1016849 RepID=A0ABR0JJG9_9EURO|nr:hypothetical protein LTS07_003106 [Exophiala sideris]KAK5042482.1 hypothetical protein LTR13_001329 [Exophiala sideris]KAK5065564.1 hypothetical protein LTR69_003113 [Exophiala sideris]
MLLGSFDLDLDNLKSTILVVLTASSLVYACYLIWNNLLKREAIPKTLRPLPGPPTRPFVGNAGQFNPLAPYSTFQKWAKEYGPIYRVKLGSQTYISVNDARIAKELFERRGNKYNSRISTHVGYELLSQERRITFTPHGDKHNTFRKQIHNILSISKTRDNQRFQELESRQLLKEFLEYAGSSDSQPADVQQIFRRYTASIMMTLSFGHRIKDLAADGLVETIFTIMEGFGKAIQPGQYLVDAMPMLKHLPYFLKPWEQEVDREIKWQWPFMYGLLQRVEEQMDKGIPNIGLIRQLAEQRKRMSEREREEKFIDDRSIGYQSMTLMEAGADTTGITMMNFALAMLLHPEVQAKGREAIDRAVDDSRLPTFEDLPNANYINQIVKEVMRWRPVITLGIPHANTTEDEYAGYYIPKDSIVYGNIWNINHDPSRYEDPDKFRPERYDGVTGSAFELSTVPNALDRDHVTFGWGRRICAGMHLAERSVMLVAARILWAFEIEPARDAEGNIVPVTADFDKAYDHSVVASPKPFPVSFKVRSEKRKQVILESFRDAESTWEEINLDLFADVK